METRNETAESKVRDSSPSPSRRHLLGWTALGGSLVAAYGTFAAFLGRFLYPARAAERGWLFVRETDRISENETLLYRLPNGASVNVTRKGRAAETGSFIALSSTCPHLGCQVHWEPQNDRYFCPCHNGIFDPSGKATGGPPGEAGQSLPEYPLKVAEGLLYIEVPLEVAALGEGRVEAPNPVRGPGHDPCLCGEGKAPALGPAPERLS